MYGVLVRLRLTENSIYPTKQVELHNVTEIHYKYPNPLGYDRIAFESDIHGTGITYDVADVTEFDTRPEASTAFEF